MSGHLRRQTALFVVDQRGVLDGERPQVEGLTVRLESSVGGDSDARRVHPPAQLAPDAVGAQAVPHRLVEEQPEVLGVLLRPAVPEGVGRLAQRPVTLDAQPTSVADELVARGHAPNGRVPGGGVVERHQEQCDIGQGLFVEGVGDAGMEQQAVQGVAQEQRAAGLRVEELGHAQLIACRQEPLLAPVPQHEGKVTDQVVQALVAPHEVRVQDQFGIGCARRDFVAALAQTLDEGSTPVDAGIGCDPHVTAEAARLAFLLGLDAGAEERVAEPYLIVRPDVPGIRATKGHGCRHPGQQRNVEGGAVGVEQADDPTHPLGPFDVDQPEIGELIEQALEVAAQRRLVDLVLAQQGGHDGIEGPVLPQQLPDATSDFVQAVVVLGAQVKEDGLLPELLVENGVGDRDLRTLGRTHENVPITVKRSRSSPPATTTSPLRSQA